MNRIVDQFARLKRAGQKGFVVYIGAGDPDLETTRQLALAFDRAGVDVLELGVPFSDPLADGLVNQLAAQRGLESGTTPPKLLETVAAIRRDSQIPIVLYIYFNLIHRVGLDSFIAAAAAAGVDGLLVLDLPPEESERYEALMSAAGLCHIYLVAPTTPDDRMALIVRRGSGFIYYIIQRYNHCGGHWFRYHWYSFCNHWFRYKHLCEYVHGQCITCHPNFFTFFCHYRPGCYSYFLCSRCWWYL